MAPPIVIADDHPLMRGALRQAVIQAAPDVAVVDVDTLAGARESIAAAGASLLLLDLHMDDSDGFAGLIGLRQDYPAIPIIVVSASDDDWVVRRAIQFGASGFMSKSSSMADMGDAFESVLAGDLAFPDIDEDACASADEDEAVRQIGTLTPAQLRVLMGLAEGKLNKQIAFEMGISEATVKAHVTAVFRKLDVINRTQAVIKAKALIVSEAQVAD